MGNSNWSDDFYRARTETRARTGRSAFAYSADVRAGLAKREVHAAMNPKEVTRESRDSENHPESMAIMVFFDITGSMGGVPVQLQKKLPQLNSLLTKTGYVKDPQVFMGAVGDETCDPASLQTGQFESGIEMDDDLERMWLVGGGGGSFQESYQNAIYFAARHTSIDCFEKRNKKGYLFLMGDELPYPAVSKKEVEALMGDTLQADISTEDIIKEAQEKYHVFFIIPAGTHHARDPRLANRWTELLGADHVLHLDDPDLVCETIAATVGLTEGTCEAQVARDHMVEAGTPSADADTVMAALSAVTGAEVQPRNVRL